ncbi:MAG: DUF5985 family protein [Myxococcota bacterium]|nr:DUF5985 family protein [Myxococcota bacterium]
MTTSAQIVLLMLGAAAAANTVLAAFFFHFWKKTHDRFFGLFAVAFTLLMINRVLLGLLPGDSEHVDSVYGIRLFAFLMIIFAIVDKNRKAGKKEA